MLYRNAREEDLPDLTALGLAAYGGLKVHLSEKNWQKMQHAITSEENLPLLVRNNYSQVCEENKRLIGMAYLVPSGNLSKVYSDKTCYIRMVAVHPNTAGKGIAQHLVKLCIGKAMADGEKKISLHSAEVMYAARHVYEKLGFKKVRLLDEHYGLAYWLYTMNL